MASLESLWCVFIHVFVLYTVVGCVIYVETFTLFKVFVYIIKTMFVLGLFMQNLFRDRRKICEEKGRQEFVQYNGT